MSKREEGFDALVEASKQSAIAVQLAINVAREGEEKDAVHDMHSAVITAISEMRHVANLLERKFDNENN